MNRLFGRNKQKKAPAGGGNFKDNYSVGRTVSDNLPRFFLLLLASIVFSHFSNALESSFLIHS